MTARPGCFFASEGAGFRPTELCRGPWHEDFQHGGPPSALIGRAIEHFLAGQGADFQIARIDIEIVRPVPLLPMAVECRFTRRGRQVVSVEAELHLDDGTVVCRARALGIRNEAVELPASRAPDVVVPRSPQESSPVEFNFFSTDLGYHAAMELRSARGTLGDGDVVLWMRQRVPLVDDETLSPLQRVLVVADSGNGVSQRYDGKQIAFMNPDLDVCLFRPAVGEWIALEAITWPGDTGIGLADTRLWDCDGVIGRGTQTLLFAPV